MHHPVGVSHLHCGRVDSGNKEKVNKMYTPGAGKIYRIAGHERGQ